MGTRGSSRWKVTARAVAGALAVSLALAGIAATATGDDRTSAVAILDVLEHDAAHKTVTAEPVALARAALERATRMRTAGDEKHARLSDGLALEWALTARDLARAGDVEQQARSARVDALDAGARAERERALLEEGIARTGRLRAEREQKDAPARTSTLGAGATVRTNTAAARPRRAAPAAGGTDGGAR